MWEMPLITLLLGNATFVTFDLQFVVVVCLFFIPETYLFLLLKEKYLLGYFIRFFFCPCCRMINALFTFFNTLGQLRLPRRELQSQCLFATFWMQSVSVVSALVLRAAEQERLAKQEHESFPSQCLNTMFLCVPADFFFFWRMGCGLFQVILPHHVIYQTVTALCMSKPSQCGGASLDGALSCGRSLCGSLCTCRM